MLGDTWVMRDTKPDMMTPMEGRDEDKYQERIGWWTSVVSFIKTYIAPLVSSTAATNTTPEEEPRPTYISMYQKTPVEYLPAFPMDYSTDFRTMPFDDESKNTLPPTTPVLNLFHPGPDTTDFADTFLPHSRCLRQSETDSPLIETHPAAAADITQASSQSYYAKRNDADDTIDIRRRNFSQQTDEALPPSKVAVYYQNYGVRIRNVSDLVADINKTARTRNQPRRTKAGPFRRSLKTILKHKLRMLFKKRTHADDDRIQTGGSFFEDF